MRRKAVVVHAVRTGSISLQEACRRYHLSVEEFLAWQRAIELHGVPGLRVTRLQIYRDTDDTPKPSTTPPPSGRRASVPPSGTPDSGPFEPKPQPGAGD